MAKGFTKKKDGKNKFIPTQGTKKSSLSSKDIRKKTTVQKSKGDDLKQRKMHTTKDIWTYDEASPELQEKIIENLRQMEYENGDDFFAEYDGIIYDKKSELSDYDVFNNYTKKYYDLDRGQYIQFPELVIKDEKKLFKMLELPKSLEGKVEISFISENETNTKIDFYENDSSSSLALVNFDGDLTYKEYREDIDKYDPEMEKPLTEKEFDGLVHATKKWNDMMDNAWSSLRDNYEYQFSDEALKEKAQSDYDFDEDGHIV